MTEKSPSTPRNTVALAILVAVTLACLLPFCTRAFNIDEPLFLWVARQIQAHPLDFYGFRINWYGTEMPASGIIKNPPLAAYYLALAAAVTGWHELPLHLAFLLPALAAVLGTYLLAREFTGNPLLATLIAILNPVFLLSSTTVMCDTTMLAFFVWAVYLWVYGLRRDHVGYLVLAAILVGLSALTKYFGVSLIPLLLVYTLAVDRGKWQRALLLLIPVALLALYQYETFVWYDRGLLSDAAGYASREKGARSTGMLASLATGLSFTGGCFLSTLFFALKLNNRRHLLKALLIVPCCALILFAVSFSHVGSGASWGYYLQLTLLMAAGANLLALTWLELREHKGDPAALLLALWVLGTFVFAAVVNWSVNGRSILPMTPAIGILVMRFLERENAALRRAGLQEVAVPLILAFALSMTITWADFRLADTARSAARTIAASYPAPPRPIWFQGHWGFQYYLQEMGGIPYDRKKSVLQAGDLMVIPANCTNMFQEIYDRGTPRKVLQFSPASFVSTMNYSAGAGYYASSFGPLPFLFGTGFEESYHIVDFSGTVPPP